MLTDRVLFLHLCQEVSRSLSSLETDIAQMGVESLAIDNHSSPELIHYARQFLQTEGTLALIVWREEGCSWGSAQPLLREVMARASSIHVLTNNEDPMLSKLKTKLASYAIVTEEKGIVALLTKKDQSS